MSTLGNQTATRLAYAARRIEEYNPKVSRIVATLQSFPSDHVRAQGLKLTDAQGELNGPDGFEATLKSIARSVVNLSEQLRTTEEGNKRLRQGEMDLGPMLTYMGGPDSSVYSQISTMRTAGRDEEHSESKLYQESAPELSESASRADDGTVVLEPLLKTTSLRSLSRRYRGGPWKLAARPYRG